jgi:hypothetical protein
MGHHAIMEFADHGDESGRTTVFSHDLPQYLHTDGVKGFGEIHKDGVQALVLFLAFFLQLSGGKDNVGHAPACSESALALQQQAMLQVLQEMVQ